MKVSVVRCGEGGRGERKDILILGYFMREKKKLLNLIPKSWTALNPRKWKRARRTLPVEGRR